MNSLYSIAESPPYLAGFHTPPILPSIDCGVDGRCYTEDDEQTCTPTLNRRASYLPSDNEGEDYFSLRRSRCMSSCTSENEDTDDFSLNDDLASFESVETIIPPKRVDSDGQEVCSEPFQSLPPIDTQSSQGVEPTRDSPRSPEKEKTNQIAQEIINSERSYVNGLLMIQKVFLCPLLESLATDNEILPRNSITRIFSNILDIVNLNNELLRQLEEELKDLDEETAPRKIAKIFLDIAPFLKMYSMYARNFNIAISTVSTHSNQNSAFAKFIKTANERPECGALRFESHLILPVQRIPRYEMLLKQLSKSIGEDHPDYLSLNKALRYVEDVAKYINEMIRAGEKSIMMVNIQRSLTNFSENLFVPGRTFIHQGVAKKICRKNHQVRKFFLFTDVLIYASPNLVGETYSFKRKLSLRELHVSDIPDEEGEPENRFKISSREKSFVIYVDKPREKEEWISLICTAIQNLQDSIAPHEGVNPSNISEEFRNILDDTLRSQHQQLTQPIITEYYSPVWVPDNEASECACCEEPFNPVTRRKHHCRLCGEVVCHSCSSKRFIIKGKYGEEPRVERICDPCYSIKFGSIDNSHHPLTTPKPKRVLELSSSQFSEERRPSFLADSARSKTTPSRRGSIIESIRFQRTRAITMIESTKSTLRASFYGGSAPIPLMNAALRKKCDLCLEDFSIFRWRNDCFQCRRTVCFDCLNKRVSRSLPELTMECVLTKEQKTEDEFLKTSSGMYEKYFDENTKICDPCSRGIPPSMVRVNEEGGGWSIITSKSPEPKELEPKSPFLSRLKALDYL
ncbi:hypothetical protein K493DRAFT_412241 [Basidiobolus meristosporus CBS 931.73]|uniref:Dbl homology domain-containing protein n=1 Tax=Basidiobolus meristosporus CBS 931.73 TaxID=1314790 RepID=A0A1Y1X1V7_9FUNG|nr:hypothetical protein K493DRAFT_412241 [Basidiobolus meristosporus CBS 931.73]|eukprot:ORX79645.1 hypothetical protein K493DRAFT_412241 [Basidiobolus meristosporus CBS 931.73]